MTRIFLLDDIREPSEFGLYQSDNVEIVVSKTLEGAKHVIETQSKFDIWYIDYDLDCTYSGLQGSIYTLLESIKYKNGLEFLYWAGKFAQDKWPIGRVFVCSLNDKKRFLMYKHIEDVERTMLNV